MSNGKITFQRQVFYFEGPEILKNSNKSILTPIIDEKGRIEDCEATIHVKSPNK